MLTHLRISQFAIVDALDLDIPSQLSVITGETGAGKSIMIDALGLTLGDRADSGMVRAGADKADILASFDVAGNAVARQWLEANDLAAGDECLLRRVIQQDGRSRGYINGTPATLQQLRELGEMLISIHGQHEHQTLLRKDTHRELLDEYAGCLPLAREVREAFRSWQEKEASYREFRDNQSNRCWAGIARRRNCCRRARRPSWTEHHRCCRCCRTWRNRIRGWGRSSTSLMPVSSSCRKPPISWSVMATPWR